MSREWKFGDVAMINDRTRPEAPWKVAMCTRSAVRGQSEARWLIDTGEVWGSVSETRPLVVIDAEDAEQVERLAKLLWPHYSDVESARLCKTEITADALREFADPTPRIEEPTGLGAVVELADGRQAVRTWEPIQPWSHFDDGLPYLDRWDGIDAVRILSPGVPS